MNNKMKQFIKKNDLIRTGDRIVVGVSGGADSICLLTRLDAIKDEYQLELHVVHVNHGLRGQEAKEDEVYVQQVCHELGLPFHVYHYEIEKMAREHGLSTEEAGRKARYAAFLEVCQKFGCNKVAIAHNQNDNAETVLFHLIRGSGLRGLTGIPAKRELVPGVQIIRPLLETSREEIEAELKRCGRAFQTDATNLTDEYSRNKLRNQVFPYLRKELNERVVEHISNTAEHLKEIDNFIKDCVDQAYDRYVERDTDQLEIKEEVRQEQAVIQKELVRRVLRESLPEGLKDIEALHIELILELLHRQVGKSINLPGRLKIKRTYQGIQFIRSELENRQGKHPLEQQVLEIHEPGEYYLKEIGKTLKIELCDYEKSAGIPKNTYTKWFDYDKINHTVLVRTRAAGDFIQIHASGGKKKLKDYFIDRKIPQEDRDHYLLVADGKQIMWIIGDRISEGYKVSNDTKKILVISLIGGNDDGNQR